jgi:hypothetical protein
MPRHALPVNLTETDRLELERWTAAHRTPQQVSQRCRIVLAAALGREDKLIAEDLDLNFKTVALWRKRFVSEGPDKVGSVLRIECTTSDVTTFQHRRKVEPRRSAGTGASQSGTGSSGAMKWAPMRKTCFSLGATKKTAPCGA